jgi:8-oxo-dGTP pyrophosphatase MutT (NUDIX family)
MVEQYRYGIGQVCLEFPAGAIDAGESPEQAARRELLEETGFLASTLKSLGRMAPEPAKHTNWAHIFGAVDVELLKEPLPGTGEVIKQRSLTRDQLVSAISTGTIVHGIHVAAFYAAMSHPIFQD